MPEFADGALGSGTTGGGVPDDQVIVETIRADGTEQHVTRPAAEVVAWRIMCHCHPASRGFTETILPGPLVRVPSVALEDLGARRVFAVDEDVPYATEREDIEQLARSIWWDEHAAAQDALGNLSRAAAEEAAARAETNRLAQHARAAGAKWGQIGRAIGIRKSVV